MVKSRESGAEKGHLGLRRQSGDERTQMIFDTLSSEL